MFSSVSCSSPNHRRRYTLYSGPAGAEPTGGGIRSPISIDTSTTDPRSAVAALLLTPPPLPPPLLLVLFTIFFSTSPAAALSRAMSRIQPVRSHSMGPVPHWQRPGTKV